MRILDIYVSGISGYLGDVAPEIVRRKAFEGLDLEDARLDLFVGSNVLNYGKTSIYSINRDLIYEAQKVLAGMDHSFQLDGYDFLDLKYVNSSYVINITRCDGVNENHFIEWKDFLTELIKCLRVAENVIDALRYC